MVIAAEPTFRTDAFIDGAFRPALAASVRDRGPRDRPSSLAEVAAGDAADIDVAVRGRPPRVRRRPLVAPLPAERKAVMLRLADLIEANAEELALLDSLEAGKPITDCREADLPEIDQDVPLVRRGRRQAVRRDRADGPRRAGHDHPRADRRRRGRPALELPDDDGGLEGGPGAGRRQLA